MKRKERPTMAMYSADYSAWLLTLGAFHPSLQTYDITEPMPPIRCVVEPPCGVCAYCKTAEHGPDWWQR